MHGWTRIVQRYHHGLRAVCVRWQLCRSSMRSVHCQRIWTLMCCVSQLRKRSLLQWTDRHGVVQLQSELLQRRGTNDECSHVQRVSGRLLWRELHGVHVRVWLVRGWHQRLRCVHVLIRLETKHAGRCLLSLQRVLVGLLPERRTMLTMPARLCCLLQQYHVYELCQRSCAEHRRHLH